MMTNYEKVKKMSIEEMVEWLGKANWVSKGCSNCVDYCIHHSPEDCKKFNCEGLDEIKEWLSSETERELDL